MYDMKWLKCSLIRAAKTFFQTAAAMIPTVALITEVDWLLLIQTAGLAAVLSLCTSLGGLPEVEK